MLEKDRLLTECHPVYRNTIDETKQNYGLKSSLDRDVGKNMPTTTKSKSSTGTGSSTAFSLPEIGGGKSLSESVDEALKDASGLAAQDKAERINESAKIGGEKDLHDLAASKQP